jgi:hypothetical protein
MPERMLSLPLSGLEVRNAILDKISRSLRADCYLNDDTAYGHFEATVKITWKAVDVGREVEGKVNVAMSAATPELSNPDDSLLEQAEAEFGIESSSPNETRIETGQEVPVSTKDQEGHETERRVKIPRKAVGKGAKEHVGQSA